MNVLKREACQQPVELRLLVRELPGATQVREELTTPDALHDDEDIALILERAQHVCNERELDLGHEIPLPVNMVDLLQLDDVVFLHELDRVEVAILPLRILHAPKRPYTKCTDHLELGKTHLL